jgi:hypothetical protein
VDVTIERARRDAMWAALEATPAPRVVTPHVLGELGIRPAHLGQGIFRDKERTSGLAEDGITLSLTDTGTVYEDAFDDDAGEYFFPSTGRGDRDRAEIEATKNARRFGLPIFVVLRGPTLDTREVRRGWIETWDDVRRVFLISFREIPAGPTAVPDAPFRLRDELVERRPIQVRPRVGQSRFRFDVFRRYGARCALCHVRAEALLEAVHLCGVASGGSNHPQNGLVLCRNQHKALDAFLFGINPKDLAIVPRPGGPPPDELGIQRPRLELPALPHPEALEWHWEMFRRQVAR